MPISAIDAISPAFQHTKRQLFQPFRFAQWAKLALVGMLAGELTSGGCNFQPPSGSASGTHRFFGSALPNMDPALMAALIAFVIVFGSALFLLLLYVSSVMRFILFDAVIAENCQVRRSWGPRQGPGWRYFLWRLVLYVVGIGGMVILIGIPAAIAFSLGWFSEPKAHLIGLILGGMLLFLVFFAFIVAWLLAYVLAKDFVVPQMAIENISAFEAWERLWPQLKGEVGGYAVYIVMKIVMALGVAVVVGIITFIVILLLLIPVGGLGAVAVLGGKAAGLQWNLYTISLAVVVACILLALIVYVIAFISVPAMVFFPAYAIYFFASRYPRLDALLHPAPPPPPLPQGYPPPMPEPGISG